MPTERGPPRASRRSHSPHRRCYELLECLSEFFAARENASVHPQSALPVVTR